MLQDMAKRGCRVIMACRNLKLASEVVKEINDQVKNADVVVKYVDLASLQSVRAFAHDIIKTEISVDILVNNAGVFMGAQAFTKDGFEMHFGGNKNIKLYKISFINYLLSS